MRGEDQRSEVLFSYVRLETASRDHPLRAVRTLIDEARTTVAETSTALRARRRRRSRRSGCCGLLLQAFYTVRSERQLMEQLNYNLLFRGSSGSRRMIRCGMRRSSARTGIGLLDRRYRGQVLVSVFDLPQVRKLLSGEHFSVDGTLIELGPA